MKNIKDELPATTWNSNKTKLVVKFKDEQQALLLTSNETGSCSLQIVN